jgi:hypothetical protein
MSNASVIQRIRDLLDDFRSRALQAEELERAIDFHMEALECVDLATIHRSRELSHKIVQAYYCDGDEEFGDPVDLANSIWSFHDFLDELQSQTPT